MNRSKQASREVVSTSAADPAGDEGNDTRGAASTAGVIAFCLYLLKRLGFMIASLVGGSFLVYSAMQIGSSRELAALTQGKPRSPAEIASLEHQFRLNQPFWGGFVSWIGHAARGDFGVSIIYREPVAELVRQRAGVTVFLVCYSSVIFLLVGLLFGVTSAVWRGRVDSILTSIGSFFVAVPPFVAGIFLILAFAVKLPLLPGFGSGSGFTGELDHTTLPSVALALGNVAIIARVVKISMRDELRSSHVTSAVSQGLSRAQVLRRHVFRNSLIPVTTIAGVNIGYLVVGSVIVDQVFSLNGLGMLLTQAVTGSDMAVVQLLVLMIIALFVAVNTTVDIVYSLLDPRLRVWRR